MFLSSIIDFLGLSLIAPFMLFFINFENEYLIIFGQNFDREQALALLGSSILLAYSIKCFVAIFLQKKIINFSNDQLYEIRSKLMRNLVSEQYSILNRENTNELIYDIQTLTATFTGKVLTVGLRLASDLIICFAIILALAYQNFVVFFLLLLITLLFTLLYHKFVAGKVPLYGKLVNNASDELLKALMSPSKDLKNYEFWKQVLFLDRFNNATYFSYQFEESRFSTTMPRYLVEVIMIYFVAFSCFGLIVLGYGVSEVIATMAVFSFAAGRLIPSINAIARAALQLKFGRDTTERLFKRLCASEEAQDRAFLDTSNVDVPKFKQLSIKNVSFSYSDDKLVLEKVNLEIKANQVVAIVGESGVGKSTLADIILGFLSPNHGQVLLNSKPINRYLSEWLDMVGYLPQDTLTVDKSLRYNVSLSDVSSEKEDFEIISALNKVGLKVFENLEFGLDTRLGENGSLLSGGQKQRVSIARALFHKRQILVLDEVTSALDEKSESHS